MTNNPTPPVLSAEERRMFQKHDFTGLDHLHCEQIRAATIRTSAQEQRLAKHDKEVEEMRSDPRGTLHAAHEAIDHGTTLLLRLIESGLLHQELHSTDGEDFSSDEAFDCLASRIDYLTRQLVRLAEKKTPHACMHLWCQAKTLAEAFGRLALIHPQEFRSVAESSLTMPSLRACNPKFSADSSAIAAAVHLAKKHPAPDISDNRSRVGAACHLVIARIFERIMDERRHCEWQRNTLEIMRRNGENPEKYQNMSLRDFLSRCRQPHHVDLMLTCAELPEWPNDTSRWWTNGVLPLVRNEFELLAQDPARNPALWEELKRGGERDTVNDMRRYMEKLCHNKFVQVVKTCPQMPLP